MVLTIVYNNFKCEDCGGDRFTLHDNFEFGKHEITIFCATKDCGASYSFRPSIKFSSSSHQPKRCPCGCGLLSREDNYCNYCGKKNPNRRKVIMEGGKKSNGKKQINN